MLFVFEGTQVFSQTDSLVKPIKNPKLCEITMRDGSSYKGHIEKQNDSTICLKSSSGVVIYIPKHNVSNIDFAKGTVSHDTSGVMQIHSPGIYNYYYTTSSNAFLFKKGEIYGSTNYLIFGNINYAFNRNFSLGVSTSIIGVPMGLHAKANFELSHKFYLGFEAVIGSLMYINPKTWGTGGTLKLTYGDEHKNFTFYGGYFDAEYWVKPQRKGRRGRPPVTTPGNYYLSYATGFAGVAFSSRISDKTHFVADFFAFPLISIYTASIGLRGSSKQKISWSGGFQFVINVIPAVNRTYPVPYFGFSYRL